MSNHVISHPFNPYESPPIVEQREVVPEQQGRRHHLSNRFMSIVFGLPGLAMFVTASAVLASAVVLMFEPRTPANISIVFLFGTVGFVLGSTMLWVAIFLWRYDSRNSNRRTDISPKMVVPPESLSL